MVLPQQAEETQLLGGQSAPPVLHQHAPLNFHNSPQSDQATADYFSMSSSPRDTPYLSPATAYQHASHSDSMPPVPRPPSHEQASGPNYNRYATAMPIYNTLTSTGYAHHDNVNFAPDPQTPLFPNSMNVPQPAFSPDGYFAPNNAPERLVWGPPTTAGHPVANWSNYAPGVQHPVPPVAFAAQHSEITTMLGLFNLSDDLAPDNGTNGHNGDPSRGTGRGRGQGQGNGNGSVQDHERQRAANIARLYQPNFQPAAQRSAAQVFATRAPAAQAITAPMAALATTPPMVPQIDNTTTAQVSAIPMNSRALAGPMLPNALAQGPASSASLITNPFRSLRVHMAAERRRLRAMQNAIIFARRGLPTLLNPEVARSRYVRDPRQEEASNNCNV
ncbi:hypothetical protein K402DRAFT_14770 [Aulographum hederae CBS 113979]|uniref:Uncharacterized protein n=1 Tax=Aulographum hederae CBS 113979 TaxID=1176131 RepID=A0A6G1H7U7_9PEZI|nr:hypothetical protein K402DRAFT_14770 [Aulographum hederae CBS 113979]